MYNMVRIFGALFLYIRSYHVVAKSKKVSSIKTHSSILTPKSLSQQKYFDYLNDFDVPVVLGVGPAGTGKTLFACHSAVEHLRSEKVSKIILTRPSVSVDEDIGYLPGSVLKKMDPFIRPLFDILFESYTRGEIDSMIQQNIIEISTLGFMRGRTFKNAFIVADEMQNSSPSQMKMLLTRLGEKTRLVITGDLAQSDLGFNNGLADFFYRIREKGEEDIPGIRFTEFSREDVQRSAIVSTILGLYSGKSL
jgi:phosphate starvation-inducible PhoH-like protein